MAWAIARAWTLALDAKLVSKMSGTRIDSPAILAPAALSVKRRALAEKVLSAVTTTNLDDLPEKSPFPGWRGKFIRSAGMTFVYWHVPAGTVLPEHSHPHEQVAHMFEGEFEIVVDGVAHLLRPGSVSIIPPHAVHSGRAITDCRILDVFCPVREDYIQYEG